MDLCLCCSSDMENGKWELHFVRHLCCCLCRAVRLNSHPCMSLQTDFTMPVAPELSDAEKAKVAAAEAALAAARVAQQQVAAASQAASRMAKRFGMW